MKDKKFTKLIERLMDEDIIKTDSPESAMTIFNYHYYRGRIKIRKNAFGYRVWNDKEYPRIIKQLQECYKPVALTDRLDELKELRAKGHTFKEIAEIMGYDESYTNRVYNKYLS